MSIGQLASTGKTTGGGGNTNKLYDVTYYITWGGGTGKLKINFLSNTRLTTASQVFTYIKNFTSINVNGCYVPDNEHSISSKYYTVAPYVIYPRENDYRLLYTLINVTNQTAYIGEGYFGTNSITNISCREIF